MSKIVGFLTKIDGRESKFGTYYSLIVNGQKYDTGSKFPPKGITAGDYIQFDVAKNDRGYETIVAGSLSKTDAPAGVAAPAPPAASVISQDRQDTISKQAALNSALAFVDILVAAGAIPDGKSLTTAQKADKLEAIVMSMTAKFFRASTGAEYEVADDVVAGAVEAGATNWAEQE